MARRAHRVPAAGRSSANDLTFFLVSRFVAVILFVVVVEYAVVWLETSVMLPWLQGFLSFSSIVHGYEMSLADLQRWVIDIVISAFAPDGASAFNRSVVVAMLFLMLLLVLLPVFAGALVFSSLVKRRVDALIAEREEEHARQERRRSLFITDIAHDLRTPIMAVSGMSHAMLDGLVSDPGMQREYQRAICEKTDRMGNLVNMVFDYAKLGSEGFQLKREYLDLPQLLLQEAAAVYSEAEDAGMVFEVMVPEDRCTVFADPAQLGRLVANLLVNAIRHNPAGAIIVLYLTRRAGVALVYVADTGVPIEGEPDRLFQPFARGDASRSSAGGTGLGLSIVKTVADMHGYRIELQQPSPPYTKAFVLQCPVED